MGEEVNPSKTEEEDLSHLFTLDNNPTHVSDDLDIPVYSSKFQTLKEKSDLGEESVSKKPKPRLVTCWNCGGEHNLRDCTKERNLALIAQNRSENLARYSNKVSRYHTDEEQAHAHLRPGKISEALRNALGLRADQAPPYIYRMRKLGYPPGWVEEAQILHSGITMFDSTGQEVKDPELEDGEIVSKEDRVKYDIRKLIEYPGFNVPLEEGMTDETEVYRAHPMKESHSVKRMLQLWSGKKMESYKRRKLKTQSTPSGSDAPAESSAVVVADDMDLDAEGATGEAQLLSPSEQPDSRVPKFPSPPPPPGVTPTSSCAATAVKRKLSVEEEESSPAKTAKLETTKDELEDSIVTESDEQEIKNISFQSPAASFNGRVKSVYTGTPVITVSEFKRLPSPEKFSKNICDVINFENLPNSTGKYEQMRGLVKKVRDYVSMSSLKSDESDSDEEEDEN